MNVLAETHYAWMVLAEILFARRVLAEIHVAWMEEREEKQEDEQEGQQEQQQERLPQNSKRNSRRSSRRSNTLISHSLLVPSRILSYLIVSCLTASYLVVIVTGCVRIWS